MLKEKTMFVFVSTKQYIIKLWTLFYIKSILRKWLEREIYDHSYLIMKKYLKSKEDSLFVPFLYHLFRIHGEDSIYNSWRYKISEDLLVACYFNVCLHLNISSWNRNYFLGNSKYQKLKQTHIQRVSHLCTAS